MATNPDDIRLSEEARRRLADLADTRGMKWSDLMEELIDSAEAIIGIRRGLESASRGEEISADSVHDAIRSKFGLSS